MASLDNVLLVYPEHPRDTYWSFRHALPFIGKRAAMPPLGLITVAALLPPETSVRLVDMNVEPLTASHLAWADVVMTSTMVVQAPSLDAVARRARAAGVPVVAGGPHPSIAAEKLEHVDHVIVGEAEAVLGEFLDDFLRGAARRVYTACRMPPLDETSPPRFDLLDHAAYGSMAVQYSRGCPFQCEFCDIWRLYGRRPRTKPAAAMLRELDALCATGYRGSVFVVDDNFIGDPRRVLAFLGELVAWQCTRGYPFRFFTEASMNLATNEALLGAMRDAGFNMVFLGIETPAADSLRATGKHHNLRRDLLDSVRTIQGHGIEVAGGFIVGFDQDTPDIFARQAEFVTRAGIPMAMVGILTALEGTALAERLEREGRLRRASEGDNTHRFETNFTTVLPSEILARGYRDLLAALYPPSLRSYFARCRALLRRLGRNDHFSRTPTRGELVAFARSLSLVPRRRFGLAYAAFLAWTLARVPRHFAEAVRLGIMGVHFGAITHSALALDDLRRRTQAALQTLEARLVQRAASARRAAADRALTRWRTRLLRRLRRAAVRFDGEARQEAEATYLAFVDAVDERFMQHVPPAAERLRHARARLGEIRAQLAAAETELARWLGHERQQVSAGVAAARERLAPRLAGYRERLGELRTHARALPREYRHLARRELAAVAAKIEAAAEAGTVLTA